MAQELAKPGHNAGNETLYVEMWKSYFRIEDEKNSLRQRHRSELGELTEQQADVKARVKDAGFSQAAFMLLVGQEKRRRAYENDRAKLEADVLERSPAAARSRAGGVAAKGGAWAGLTPARTAGTLQFQVPLIPHTVQGGNDHEIPSHCSSVGHRCHWRSGRSKGLPEGSRCRRSSWPHGRAWGLGRGRRLCRRTPSRKQAGRAAAGPDVAEPARSIARLGFFGALAGPQGTGGPPAIARSADLGISATGADLQPPDNE